MSSSVIMLVIIAVLKKPLLWPVALKQLWRIRKSNWYTKPPFLPIPEKSYIEFRIHTAYGTSEDFSRMPTDVVTYLSWCRDWPSRR